MIDMAVCDVPTAPERPEAARGARPRGRVSVVIPVYNEFRSLATVLDRVIAAPLPPGLEKEIVVVDDGSTDGTAEVVDRYAGAQTPVVVHHSVVNFGKGAAIRVGLAKATGDYILIQDGDTEYDPAEYPTVLAPLVSGRAAVVYGSRFGRGRPSGMKGANWLANRLLTATVNLLYGARIGDEATGTKAFRADVLRSIRLRCLGFEFCPEVTAKVLRSGHRIVEVPIGYNARGIPEGKKIRWHHGVEALWTLVKYRFVPLASFRVAPSPAAAAALPGAAR